MVVAAILAAETLTRVVVTIQRLLAMTKTLRLKLQVESGLLERLLVVGGDGKYRVRPRYELRQ